jgi:hypothetical protein
LCIGDSVTFGHGLPYSSTYPQFLEKILNESGKGVYEVILAAYPGWNTDRKTEAFFKALPYQPDMLIYQYDLNDINWNFKKPDPTWADSLDAFLMQKSRFYMTYKFFFWIDLGPGLGFEPNFVKSLTASYSEENPEWRKTKQDLQKIFEACNERNILPLFLESQVFLEIKPGSGLYQLVELARRTAEDQGYMTLPLYKMIHDHSPRSLRVHITDLHPNEKANKIIAGKIRQYMQENRLLGFGDSK